MPFPPITITERLLHAVKRLEVTTPAGIRLATGYCCQVPVNADRSLPAIITTRHALAQASAVSARFHLAGAAGPLRESTTLRMAGETLNIVQHPRPGVDLAALLHARAIVTWQEANPGRQLFSQWLDETAFFPEERWEELDMQESVAVIGAPEKLWDESNNLPLLLAGSTASHPLLDYNGQPEFVVSARMLPGMSGAPVLLQQVGARGSRTPEAFAQRSRFGLLGTLRGGMGADPHGLGLVVKASETRSLLESIRADVAGRLKPN